MSKLWDLESLGILQIEEVYKEFVDSVRFNGSRYSVKLLWKEGQSALPDNYKLSFVSFKQSGQEVTKGTRSIARV